MRRLYQYAVEHPRRVLISAAVLTLAVAPGLAMLRLRTDGHALVPTASESVVYDAHIRETFGIRDPFVVVIRTEHASGIFNYETLRFVKLLTDDFAKLEDVEAHDIFSLATEHNHRVVPGTLNFRRFLDPLPHDSASLVTFRDDITKIGLYAGTLIGKDESSTTVMVGAPPGRDRVEMFKAIRSLVDRRKRELQVADETEVIGAPVAEALLGSHLLGDLGVPAGWLGHQHETAEEDPFSAAGTGSQEAGGLGEYIIRHVGLVPLAIGVMAIVFLICFRNLAAAVLPLAEVGAALLFVFGVMGYVGVPVYLTIAVLPVILTAIGIADEIHVYARFRENLQASGSDAMTSTVLSTMDEMYRPIINTSVTTAIGFLSFAFSPIGPVQAFGVFTAIGVVFCMLWSISVVPAMLVLMPRRWHGTRSSFGTRLSAWLGSLSVGFVRIRWLVLPVLVAVMIAAPAAVRRIEVQDSWINGFAPTSGFYRSTMAFNDDFLGMHTLLLVLETSHDVVEGELDLEHTDHHTISIPAELLNDPDDVDGLVGRHLHMEIPVPPEFAGDPKRRPRPRVTWIEDVERRGDRIAITLPKRSGSPRIAMEAVKARVLTFRITPRQFLIPDTLHKSDALAKFVDSQSAYAVGGVIGPADYVRTTSLMSRALKEEARVIPEEPQRVNWLWSQYERIRGTARRRQIVDDDHARALLTVFLEDANFKDTASLMALTDQYVAEHLAPSGIRVQYAGDVAVSQTLIGAIVATQVQSVLLSLVGVLIAASVLGRSVWFGVLAVLPCAFAVLMNFALMGLTGMPLGVATSMFAGMTLGIGVDFAIHWLSRYRRTYERGGDRIVAIRDAVSATGPAIMVDALAVALGFGLLTMSSVPANARLGVLVVTSLIGCLLATLLLLPAVLSVIPQGRGSRLAAVVSTSSNNGIESGE